MFWDKVSPVYDVFENVYNHKVYTNTGKRVAEEITADDLVLECACGTGEISRYIARRCRYLIATDMSAGMLKRTKKKLAGFGNFKVGKADITHLRCSDERFDKVVAGNVIHLLDDPYAAMKELMRVCKLGGKVVIPTYINRCGDKDRKAVKFLEAAGAKFNRQFDIFSYKEFFDEMGYTDADYTVVDGRMPCAIAVITKK